jgi:hypothetical protein
MRGEYGRPWQKCRSLLFFVGSFFFFNLPLRSKKSVPHRLGIASEYGKGRKISGRKIAVLPASPPFFCRRFFCLILFDERRFRMAIWTIVARSWAAVFCCELPAHGGAEQLDNSEWKQEPTAGLDYMVS